MKCGASNRYWRPYIFCQYSLWSLLERVKEYQGIFAISSVYLHTWNVFVTKKKKMQSLHTWNTSLLFTRTVGIIQRYLKFFDSLRICMTFGIFLNWAQGFTFCNCCTIDLVALTCFFTIRFDEGLVGRKCLIMILT